MAISRLQLILGSRVSNPLPGEYREEPTRILGRGASKFQAQSAVKSRYRAELQVLKVGKEAN